MNSCLLSNKRRVNTFNHGVSKQVACSCFACKESTRCSLVSLLVGNQAGKQTLLNRLVPRYRQTHPPVERQERVSVGRGLALQDFENKVQALPPYISYHQHRLQTAGNIFSNKFTPSSLIAK